MNKQGLVKRREFLCKSVLGMGAGVLGGSVIQAGFRTSAAAEQAAPLLPKVKRRRLGRTEIEISEISGAGDTLGEPLIFTAVYKAGVNYIHKADELFRNEWARAILLRDREQMFLDVIIDSIDESAAYSEFERKRRQMGVEYVDFFKAHTLWETVEDFQNKRGVLKAYDRLKKEKKVRWLALSKHGRNTAEVLIAAMDSGLFDAIQPAVQMAGEGLGGVLKSAKEKDIGVICMKTGAATMGNRAEFAKFGSPSKPYQTYYRYLLSLPGVTSIVSTIRNMDHLHENLGASGAPMIPSEMAALRQALASAPANFRNCIGCGECHKSCPCGLAVSDIMRYRVYAEDYGDLARARSQYRQLPAAWRKIVASGEGISRTQCPYGLPLESELKRAHQWLA